MIPSARHAPSRTEYWCFISYRHADNQQQGRQWATWLHQQIETYEVPADLVGTTNERGDILPERIFPVFRDEDELPADADLSAPIGAALERSKFLVVLCSPRAAQSFYVAHEIHYFKKLGKSSRVLAALIEGEPNASWDLGKRRAGIPAEAECFPEPLRHPVDAGGNLIRSEQAEPIAADFRLPDRSQGWTSPEAYRQALREDGQIDAARVDLLVADYARRCELAKLKILAGVLGIPLGQLTRRDKTYQLEKARRRARVFLRVAAAMIALAACAVTAGIFAVKREKDARRAKATSDDLSEFMIVDLHDRLARVGRLDLLDAAATKLAGTLDPTAPADRGDRLRGLKLRLQVAKIRFAQGRIDDAYQTAAQVEAIPGGDRELSLAAADLMNLAGDLGIRIGRMEGEALARQAAELFRAVDEPARLAQALVNLADYHFLRRDASAGGKCLAEAETLATRAAAVPVPAEPREILLRVLLRKCRMQVAAGDLTGGIATMTARGQLLDRYAAEDPDHWTWEREKVLNGIEESKLRQAGGEPAMALGLAGEALRDALRLESRDPGNLEWTRLAATASNHRGHIRLAGGNADAAREDFAAGLSRLRTLTAFSPRNLGWQAALAWTHDGLRGALTARDDRDGALEESRECVRLLRAVHQEMGAPPRGESARELAMALANAAALQLERLDLEDASALAADAAGQVAALVDGPVPGEADAALAAEIAFLRMEIAGARSDAPAALAAAREGRDHLLRASPGSLRLAQAHMRVARAEAETGAADAARASAVAAREILEQWLAREPSDALRRDLDAVREFISNTGP
jgi:hypothetical protein